MYAYHWLTDTNQVELRIGLLLLSIFFRKNYFDYLKDPKNSSMYETDCGNEYIYTKIIEKFNQN